MSNRPDDNRPKDTSRPKDNDGERCVCGVVVKLSDKWWHRSVCAGWQEGSRPVASVVRALAEALAVEEGGHSSSWELFVGHAKCVLQVLREPTAEMVDAGADVVWNRDALVAAYQAMIDAALKGRAGGDAPSP